MAEATKRKVADYYRMSGGFTVGMTVCQDGEVLTGAALGPDFEPETEEEQYAKWGKLLYRETTPPENIRKAIDEESANVYRSLRAGMQHPNMPPITDSGARVNGPALETLDRYELRERALRLGLKFGEDADRDQMIGAIKKREAANAAKAGKSAARGRKAAAETEESDTPEVAKDDEDEEDDGTPDEEEEEEE